MLRKKEGKSRELIDHSFDSSVIAEFAYLNTMTIMRIDTTHYVWFGSIVAEGVLVSLGMQYKSEILLCINIALMIPFVLSMAFQLRYICRIRTYVTIFITPALNNSYDKQWASLTGAMNTDTGILGLKGITYVLLLPYFFYSIISVILCLNNSINLDLTSATVAELYNAFIHNQKNLITWLISNLLFLFSARALENSHGAEIWKTYINEWNARKSSQDMLKFKRELGIK